jgi:type II secretory pathway pseudopilin PulG
MHLEGQYATRDEVRSRVHPTSESGYAMAALLVSIALMGVFMSVAMPVWRHANQREKEAELLFRAGQYVRAVELYKRRFANAFPPTVDVLLQQRLLRKKYKDPITGGDFKLLTPADLQTAGAQTPVPRQPGRAVTPGREVTTQIAGVVSRSTAASIRIYKNRQRYDQWIVTADEVFMRNVQPQPGQPGQPGRPGQPGMPGQPGQPRPGAQPGGSMPPTTFTPGGQRPPGVR